LRCGNPKVTGFWLIFCFPAYPYNKAGNRNSAREDDIAESDLKKVGGALTLPFAVMIVANLISSVIPNAYSPFFPGGIIEFFLIFIILAPLFLAVFYILKIRKSLDLLWYVLLFSLGVVLTEEIFYLLEIIKM
jgi:hypothetical protein